MSSIDVQQLYTLANSYAREGVKVQNCWKVTVTVNVGRIAGSNQFIKRSDESRPAPTARPFSTASLAHLNIDIERCPAPVCFIRCWG